MSDLLELWVAQGGCWKPNSGPLLEQYDLLTPEPTISLAFLLVFFSFQKGTHCIVLVGLECTM